MEISLPFVTLGIPAFLIARFKVLTCAGRPDRKLTKPCFCAAASLPDLTASSSPWRVSCSVVSAAHTDETHCDASTVPTPPAVEDGTGGGGTEPPGGGP